MAELFPILVYGLCFAASSLCAWLLARSYARTSMRLLLWSAICFILIAANNLVVVVDMLLVPDMDLRILRLLCSLAAVSVLLFGFVWDLEDKQ